MHMLSGVALKIYRRCRTLLRNFRRAIVRISLTDFQAKFMGLEVASGKKLLTNLKALLLGFSDLFTDLKKLALLQRYSCLSKEHVAFLTSWDHVASETAVAHKCKLKMKTLK